MAKNYYWSGLSSETKPTGANVPVGAEAKETDTGHTYEFDGTTWRQTGTAGVPHVKEPVASIQQKNYAVHPLSTVPVATILANGKETLTLAVKVETYALGGFEVWFKHSESQDDWIRRASAAADYTTPNAPVLDASGDLTVQAVGSGWLQIDTRGVYAVQLRAKSVTPAAWATATAYAVGAVRRPTTKNNLRYVVIAVAGTGTSGGVEPTWPTSIGGTVVDNAGANQITWQAVTDASIVTIDAGAA